MGIVCYCIRYSTYELQTIISISRIPPELTRLCWQHHNQQSSDINIHMNITTVIHNSIYTSWLRETSLQKYSILHTTSPKRAAGVGRWKQKWCGDSIARMSINRICWGSEWMRGGESSSCSFPSLRPQRPLSNLIVSSHTSQFTLIHIHIFIIIHWHVRNM